MSLKRASLLFISLIFLLNHFANAQCCSTGSPAGTSVNANVLSKKTLRVLAFYRYSYSDTYYESDHRTDENVALEYAQYNFAGLTLGYGISRRLTLETDFGYFFNKTQSFKNIDFKETGYGLSNGGITMKYAFFVRPLKHIEIAGGIGMRYPFTLEPQMKNGVQLSPDVQPSTHAFGASGSLFLTKGFPGISLRVFSINRYDYNFADRNGYQYGSILTNSLFASKKIFTNFYGILQLRSELKGQDQDGDRTRQNTGYLLLTLTPQISYALAGQWNISALYDIPVYKNYHGKQLTPSQAFAISLSHDFNFGTKYK